MIEPINLKVVITGANGKCGTALIDLPYNKLFVDKEEPLNIFQNEKFIKNDFSDIDSIQEILHNVNILIHLAGHSDPEGSSDEILNNNIILTEKLFRIAYQEKVNKIIFASSNHVVGLYELENVPDIYELDNDLLIDHKVDPRPDSLYGVSKLYGESLGSYYSCLGGPKFYGIRIGALLDELNDNPFAYAENGVKFNFWRRGSKNYELQLKRLKSIWISRRDFVHLIDCSIKDQSDNVFNIFYGTSDNPRSWLDISYPRMRMGYSPKDNSENWKGIPEVYRTNG